MMALGLVLVLLGLVLYVLRRRVHNVIVTRGDISTPRPVPYGAMWYGAICMAPYGA